MTIAKLLWVDDEIELLKAHLLFLEKKGYAVDTATNGYDALDRVAEQTYDLILLDENMPGISGLETLSRIKDITPTTPVVMVTKSEEENIMDQAIGSQIADYLIKPVNPTQILLTLKKNIHRREIVTEQTQTAFSAAAGHTAAAHRQPTSRTSASYPCSSAMPHASTTGWRSTADSSYGSCSSQRPTAT